MINGPMESVSGTFSRRLVNANVPSIRTVEIPPPTAASVKATSTASRFVKSAAESKLNTPVSMTTENKWRSRKT